MMTQAWKTPQIVKGLLTRVSLINQWRRRRAGTGGSDSARYCYSVWLRHLSILSATEFRISGARVGELGPGDSIGTGLAALLSGARAYVGLDIFPFAKKANLLAIFEELGMMYANSEPIPNQEEFPGVRPRLSSYAFPDHLIAYSDIGNKLQTIKQELRDGLTADKLITYRVPWNSSDVIARGSLDLIFSQAVLEHVDVLDQTYRDMAAWLKPGGYASHVIDFRAHHLSPFWNGHWAYSELQWKLVRGNREFLLNREPLSTHLKCARQSGFDVLRIFRDISDQGLPLSSLAPNFRQLSTDDSQTTGAVLILRKRDD
jgi:SAM-dependent methyltransferase